MNFLTTFFGSFHSQALYARVRLVDTGYGVRYSVLLFGFVAVFVGMSLNLYTPPLIQQVMERLEQDASPAAGMAMILVFAALLRAGMLFALAIATWAIAVRLKMPMTHATGFRLAGVAYTPVAVLDAVVLCLRGAPLNTLIVFGCGVVMLLAALRSTR